MGNVVKSPLVCSCVFSLHCQTDPGLMLWPITWLLCDVWHLTDVCKHRNYDQTGLIEWKFRVFKRQCLQNYPKNKRHKFFWGLQVGPWDAFSKSEGRVGRECSGQQQRDKTHLQFPSQQSRIKMEVKRLGGGFRLGCCCHFAFSISPSCQVFALNRSKWRKKNRKFLCREKEDLPPFPVWRCW